MTNWGFVSINDSRKVATLEIGLDKDEFENLKYGLGAYGPQNCVLQAEVTFSDFVDDVMGGRGAVLACPPELTFKGCY